MVFDAGPHSASLVAAFALAVVLILLFVNARLNLRGLTLLSRVENARTADCMVVIPARDEEDVIERAVRSLPPDCVIVVDDDSRDKTAERAAAAGAGVVAAPTLLRGANGKSNACAMGAAALTSRWILFADADTWFEPGFMDTAVAVAEASQISFLSVYPQAEPSGIFEHILTPYFQALYFAGTDPKSHRAEVFSGHVVLARRETYEFLGGHRAVMSQASDDVRLAGLADRHRVKYAVARAPQLCHVRLYQGVKGIWKGLERQAIRFQIGSPLRAMVAITTAAAAFLWAPALAWLLWERQHIAAIMLGLLPVVLLWPWYRGPRAILAPLAIYVSVPFLLHAVLTGVTGRAVFWKGRRV
jgi:Glycosyltransferase like family 2